MVPSAWRHAVDVIQGSDVQFGQCPNKTRSEIPCRVIELPELEVIPVNKPANNGEALLVYGASRTP
jgi:hypothetical protein